MRDYGTEPCRPHGFPPGSGGPFPSCPLAVLPVPYLFIVLILDAIWHKVFDDVDQKEHVSVVSMDQRFDSGP